MQQTVANMIHQLWGNNLGKLYQCAQVQKEMFSVWNTSVALNLTLSNTSIGLGCDCEGKLEYSGKTHTQGEQANPRRKTGGSWWSFLPIIAPLCCPVDSCKLCYVSFTCLEPAWFKCNIIFVLFFVLIHLYFLLVCLFVWVILGWEGGRFWYYTLLPSLKAYLTVRFETGNFIMTQK